MSVIARLEVIPTKQASMSGAVASAVDALEDFDVSYETTPTDTVIEADDPAEVFAAAEAAHRAVADDRVVTSLEVDEYRTQTKQGRERVESVERRLGRPAKRERQQAATKGTQQGQTGREQGGQTAQSGHETRRYGGPWQSGTRSEERYQGRQRGGQTTGEGQSIFGEGRSTFGADQSTLGESQPTTATTGSEQSTSRYLRPKRPISR